MHSKKADGKLWVACSECNRGGNGTAKDKCCCGGNIKRWNKLGCFLGELITKERIAKIKEFKPCLFLALALALASPALAAEPVEIASTLAQTTTLPYEFAPLEFEDSDAPPLPEIDLVSVPFINQVGSIALTLFAILDQFQVLGIYLVILLAVIVVFWLWTYVTRTPSQVELKVSEGLGIAAGLVLGIAAGLVDAQTADIQEGVEFYQQNYTRMSEGATNQYRLDQQRIASNRQLSAGIRQGSKIFRRAKRDFGGNPFK